MTATQASTQARRGADRAKGPKADVVFVALTLAGLVAGAAAALVGIGSVARVIWGATVAGAIVPAAGNVFASLRRREPGVDIIAVLALAGTLVVGEELAGAVIAVMLATGRSLEARAGARAQRDLRALVERAPSAVHRYHGDEIGPADLDSVVPGDLLLVRPGEVVAVDGVVERAPAVLDESALTGEPLPVERAIGDVVRSGVVNAGAPFDLRATTTAADGTYAGVVRLVRQAEASSSAFVRLADRYAFAFLPLTLAIAGGAWLVSGDAVRAVAVLVVATPCPLILAAPVAIVSGLSRAARRGVIVKGGAVLERLGDAEILLFDKTGTLTAGRPTLSSVATGDGDGSDGDEMLRLAASLDQVSPHVLAASIVRAARRGGLVLALPSDVVDVPGQGVSGTVDGHRVAVGRAAWVTSAKEPAWVRVVRRRAEIDGSLTVFVAVDGAVSAVLLLDDPIRTDARVTLRRLRADGIRRLVMVTGDRAQSAQIVGAALGVDEVLAERSPAEKVDAVVVARRSGVTLMVGDGINDAPALAAADVGIALGARGATASSEAADVVLSVDRLDRVGDAVRIARRSRSIARQSVVVGMCLSLAAMTVAAAGWLPPTAGAFLQEAIDLSAIINALRALNGGERRARLIGEDAALSRRFLLEHRGLAARIDQVRDVADGLRPGMDGDEVVSLVRLRRFLEDEVLPHEEAEDAELYPVMAKALGGSDPTSTMSRGHAEIAHLVHKFGRVVEGLPASGPDDDDVRELRTILYGLHAVLRLHFAQEDEEYFSLVEEEADGRILAPGTSVAG